MGCVYAFGLLLVEEGPQVEEGLQVALVRTP